MEDNPHYEKILIKGNAFFKHALVLEYTHEPIILLRSDGDEYFRKITKENKSYFSC